MKTSPVYVSTFFGLFLYLPSSATFHLQQETLLFPLRFHSVSLRTRYWTVTRYYSLLVSFLSPGTAEEGKIVADYNIWKVNYMQQPS